MAGLFQKAKDWLSKSSTIPEVAESPKEPEKSEGPEEFYNDIFENIPEVIPADVPEDAVFEPVIAVDGGFEPTIAVDGETVFEDSFAPPTGEYETPAASPKKVVSRARVVEEPVPDLIVPAPVQQQETPVQVSPPPAVVTEKENKEGFGGALKRIVTTRREKAGSPAEEIKKEEPQKKKRPSYVERKFAPAKKDLAAGNIPMVPSDKLESELEKLARDDMRSKPLPRVKMVPKPTVRGRIWGAMRHLPILSRFLMSEKERNRNVATGLTPRQRIKRYNAIHEGGYGRPAGGNDGSTNKEEPVPANSNR